MPPILKALFSSWEWRLDILIVLGVLTTVYVIGWLRMRKQGAKLARGWRLVAYLSGMLLLITATMSPIDMLGGQLLFMHMIQHKIVVMGAAPLLWLGNPFPIGLWGLPISVRRGTTLFFARGSLLRQGLAVITQPGVAWLTFIIVYIGWHDANLYNLALRKDWVHDLQHITFFVAAMLFWQHVVGAAPRLHKRLPVWAVVAYLLLAVPPNAIAGAAIAGIPEVIYTYYESVPRIWGFSAIEDQMTAGAIMWIQGSEMLIQSAIIVIAVHWMRAGKAIQPTSGAVLSDEALIAPGLEQRVIQNHWRAVYKARSASHSQSSP
jgi:cytochrome c oxidase assembly factor CtaG